MATVKVFKSGNSQAIRIPKEFSVKEKELHIQKVGNSLLLTASSDIWATFKEGLHTFSDDYMEDGREQPIEQVRESL